MRKPAPPVVPSQDGAGESARTPARRTLCEGCGTPFTARRESQRFCRPAAENRSAGEAASVVSKN